MKNQIVILAAGKGTRMGNSEVPKVLAMLNNKPLIMHLLEETDRLGQLAKPVIVVGHGATQVKGVLGEGYSYALQEKQLGTGHAVLSAKPAIRAENILVLYGDMPLIKQESLSRLVSAHLRAGAILTLLTAEVENFSGQFSSLERFGRILRDKSGEVVGIVEFKDASESQRRIKEVNPGIYMFQTQWLWDNLSLVGNSNSQAEYYLTDIVAVAISQGIKVNSLAVSPEQVLGVNTLEELAIAEKLLG